MDQRPPIITLLTDFGQADTHIGVMKGVMLGICPAARLVDLCHELEPHAIEDAAYQLSVSYRFFPPGTVHLVVVDPGVGTGRRALAAEAAGHLFVAPDNGVLSYVADAAALHAVELIDARYFLPTVSQTFHGRDIFAPVAAHLAAGVPLDNLGPRVPDPALLPLPQPIERGPALVLHIIHVDRFGNLITDLSTPAFDKWLAGRAEGGGGRVTIRAGRETIEGVSTAYAYAAPGELLAVVGSSSRLEIAINQGNASKALSLAVGDSLEMECTVPRR